MGAKWAGKPRRRAASGARRKVGRPPGIVAAFVALAMLALTGCNEVIAAAWGGNAQGQLGTSSPVLQVSTPTGVDTTGVFASKSIVQVSAKWASSCAVATDGTVACWGRSYGQPPGTFTDVATPTRLDTQAVLPGRTPVQVAAGEHMRCVLTSDGAVGCWFPDGARRMLGVLVGQLVVQIDSSGESSCALTESGRVACWGDNEFGQLGDGTTIDRAEPVWVNTAAAFGPYGFTKQISVGGGSACALSENREAACWGQNEFTGVLGNGTYINSSLPTLITTSGVLAGKTIARLGSASGSHRCLITEDNVVSCWGSGYQGRLGNGIGWDLYTSPVPVLVDQTGVLAGKTVRDVAAGSSHTCAVLGDGTAACWGGGLEGELGNGALNVALVPVMVQGFPAGAAVPNRVATISAGAVHTLATYDQVPPSQFVSIAPVRVVDTRAPGDPTGALTQGEVRQVDLSAVVPPGTTAVTFNVTATGQTASGFLQVAPLGAPALSSSTVNWGGPQETIANGHVTSVPGDRILQITVGSTGQAHVVLDITGYFAPPGVPGAALFRGADYRIYDSRETGGALLPGQSRTLSIYNRTDVGTLPPLPVAPTAASINVTATNTTGSGVFTAAKTVSAATSTVNWSGPGQTIANAVVTDVAPDGTFKVTNNGGTTAHLVVDLRGTFAPTGAGATGAQFYPLPNSRVYDSRTTDGPLLVQGLGRKTLLPVPTDAVAAALNATVTGTTGTGYVMVHVAIFETPFTSTINWYNSPTTRANGIFVNLYEGRVQTSLGFGSAPSTQYLYDIAGYFR